MGALIVCQHWGNCHLGGKTGSKEKGQREEVALGKTEVK
jgi:hypothetical protein